MATANHGDWVQIHSVILPADQRAPHIPAETQKVPLEMRAKGFLLDCQAAIGDQVTVRTAAARMLTGKLIAINPRYLFDYGEPQPELLSIGQELRELLEVRRND